MLDILTKPILYPIYPAAWIAMGVVIVILWLAWYVMASNQ